KAALLGLSETDVASDLLVSLSGSSQTTLSFWIDPKSGTQYAIAAQTPQFRLASLGDLATTPVTGTGAAAGGGGAGGVSGGGRAAQLLANLASFHRSVAPAVVSHYDATPVVDIFGAVEGADLGFVAAQIQRVLAESKSSLPRGSQVAVHGQVKTMTDSFAGLLLGLAAAIVLVYLLIVVNFQSWLDPFIIITALPAALAGIVWMLFLSHTPVSVPALTGAIMCMGVATANSVLVVSFARERMNAGDDAAHAAVQAGVTRFRPVLMTALAMIIGIVPMALEREAAAAAVPTVATVKPKAGPGSDTLVLPGSVQAFYEAPIYARTSGYLKNWYTDIGTAVKKGRVLAEIDTPEVDQQLRQAE